MSNIVVRSPLSVEDYLARARSNGRDEHVLYTVVEAGAKTVKMCNDAYDGDDDEYDDRPSDY